MQARMLTITIKQIYLIEPASDPEEGSVRQNAANSPDVTLGKYFFFCASVPYNKIPLKPIDW